MKCIIDGMDGVSARVEAKAARYLAEGRVRVLRVSGDSAAAEVRGGELYRLEFVRGSWACDCPAWTPRCTHVLAVELVTGTAPVRVAA